MDKSNSKFAIDPQNIRLGLANNGFNPFGDLSSTNLLWSVLLLNFNIYTTLIDHKEFVCYVGAVDSRAKGDRG